MAFNKKIPALFIAALILLIIPISFANEDINLNESQEISISDNSDILMEKYDTVYVKSDINVSSENTVKSISEGLDLVKDSGTIYLEGNFKGANNTNITLASQPNRITFIGVNATVDGEFTNSFAVVKNGTYSFKDITFINNYKYGEDDQFGGCIYNIGGTLTITNCIFENNSVNSINRANGGAIDNNGYLTVNSCTFINNSAYVSNSSGFRKNAADGGAISNLGKLYVTDTSFVSNIALRNGGAIRTQDNAYASFKRCNFTDNLAAYHESGGSFGGAIYSWDCSLDVLECIFKNNKVIDISGYGAQGGAISSDRGAGKVSIISSQFINNTAEGVKIIHGQSIYFGSCDADVNYCTIDTSIYSGSLSTNFDYNLWNDKDINNLIEMLPSAASVKYYAALDISSDATEFNEGDSINILVNLYWNGTKNQDNINLIPTQKVTLSSNCGNLAIDNGDLVDGHFETVLTVNDTSDPMITAGVNDIEAVFDFAGNITISNITVKCRQEKENVIISISSLKYLKGICLVDVGENKYYAELKDGKATVNIKNLDAGEYDVSVRYYGDENETVNTKLNINDYTTVNVNTTVNVASKFTFLAVDTSAKEKGGAISFTLTDINGDGLANKSVQVAMNGKIYNTITDDTGMGSVNVNINAANTYTCAISFAGDENYNACPLTITKLTINKKKTTIKATAKTFKVKTKTKKISVTLKTVKNQFNSKTYLYKGKKLTLTVKGKTYSAKTNSKGIAKFSLKLNKKGKYSAKIKFAGDKTYKASSKTIKITVK